jgi:hypothetical protein
MFYNFSGSPEESYKRLTNCRVMTKWIYNDNGKIRFEKEEYPGTVTKTHRDGKLNILCELYIYIYIRMYVCMCNYICIIMLMLAVIL